MIPHKTHQFDKRRVRSKASISRELSRLRHGGKCAATRRERFPDFAAVVTAALIASPRIGRVQITDCAECSGFHISQYKERR